MLHLSSRRKTTRRTFCRLIHISPVMTFLLLLGPMFVLSKSLWIETKPHNVRNLQSQNTSQLDGYPLGRFGKVVERRRPSIRTIWHGKHSLQRLWHKIWSDKLRLFHLGIFVFYTYNSLESIRMDSWEAERNPEKFFGATGILQKNERDIVKRRVVSSRTIRKLVGAGYTPRLVWLYGVMLRGIIHCTALPKVFEVMFPTYHCSRLEQGFVSHDFLFR
jgi:hypothetical protein